MWYPTVGPLTPNRRTVGSRWTNPPLGAVGPIRTSPQHALERCGEAVKLLARSNCWRAQVFNTAQNRLRRRPLSRFEPLFDRARFDHPSQPRFRLFDVYLTAVGFLTWLAVRGQNSQVYDLTTTMAEQLVTTQSDATRSQCLQTLVRFILDYPLGSKSVPS